MFQPSIFPKSALSLSAWCDTIARLEQQSAYKPWQPRPSQMPPPGDWRVWLILAGRGFGKTRTGAEWTREQVKQFEYVNLIAPTADDARDIMVEGESGILNICPPRERPHYVPSKRRLEWPNGARSLIFTADEPDRLRGKQHMRLWGDELAAWRYPDAFDQAMFGLRLGSDPRALFTTTPRPVSVIRELLAAATTVITRGTTYENRENLAPAFLEQIISKYEGTRLGRQELNAELLEDNPAALWKRALLDETRVTKAPDLVRIVVAIDPSATSGGNEAGIVAAGLGADGHGYVLDDRSLQGSPHAWASAAVALYHTLKADRLVAESNHGGEMVSTTIGTVAHAPPVTLIHASRGKYTRAEPVAALYEQRRCHHVGTFAALEDEMCNWVVGDDSPNRLDALVWSLTDLMVSHEPSKKLVTW